MSILERALRLGEAKQFKAYSKRVERINTWEPELELLEDDELKEQFLELRRRVQEDGTCWLGATTWRGERMLRISVSNWSTGETDVDASVEAIRRARTAVA